MALSDLTVTARAFLQWAVEKDITGLESQSQSQDVTKQIALTFGTAAGNANQIYAGVRTLNAATTEDLDLSGTALQNPLGENIAFTTVKMVLVWLLSATDTAPGDDSITGTACSGITFGGDAASPALWFGNINDTMTLANGDCVLYMRSGTGFTITNTTADIFQVANLDAAVQAKYVLVIIGTA